MLWFGRNTKTFDKRKGAVPNPMMGYAPCAWNEKVAEDVTLLYVDITWRELEPEEGVFDWAAIEAENRLDVWRQQGKHLVLRFVCDLPGETSHMDIPDWLYEKTGGAGDWYDMEYGSGFAPDYANPVLMESHRRAVEELGNHLGADGFVGFVELGSIGHWGEWHVNYRAGIRRLPEAAVRAAYIDPWKKAFPDAHILMRRPFAEAKENGFGLYNDAAGDYDATKQWLGWIEKGGEYEQTRESGALVPMPEFWKTAPAGGELTSSLSMQYLLDSQLAQTLDFLRESHLTFLGPNVASSDYKEGYDRVLEELGYRIRISRAKLAKQGSGAKLSLDWVNDGNAPFYNDWHAFVYVMEADGKVVEAQPVTIDLRDLLPGEKIRTEVELVNPGLANPGRAGLTVAVGIEDTMTGLPAVTFAQEGKQEKGRLILFD